MAPAKRKKRPSGNRWYDKHERLRVYLDGFREMAPARRTRMVKGVLSVLHTHAPHLIDEHAMEFPLDLLRRRWYDKEPRLWLMFNGLQHASPETLEKVVAFLESSSS